MKKETLLEIILGTIGGLVFAIGMCMCLVSEWDMLIPGIVVSLIGFLVLLCIIPISRKGKPKKQPKKTDWGLVLTVVIGIFGSLIMGFGMSRILVETVSKTDMIIGLITGVVGLIICILNYPIYAYIKNPRD